MTITVASMVGGCNDNCDSGGSHSDGGDSGKSNNDGCNSGGQRRWRLAGAGPGMVTGNSDSNERLSMMATVNVSSWGSDL